MRITKLCSYIASLLLTKATLSAMNVLVELIILMVFFIVQFAVLICVINVFSKQIVINT